MGEDIQVMHLEIGHNQYTKEIPTRYTKILLTALIHNQLSDVFIVMD